MSVGRDDGKSEGVYRRDAEDAEKATAQRDTSDAGDAAEAAGEKGGYYEDDGEDDHGDAGDPGNDVEGGGVYVIAHQVAAIDEQHHENQDDRAARLRWRLARSTRIFKSGAPGIRISPPPTTIKTVYSHKTLARF